MGKVAKEWHRKKKRKVFLKLLQSLRSQLSWRELLVGLLSAIVMATILAGFSQQEIPEFKVGDIANQDVRASKDVPYVDEEATTLKRNEARASVPLVYELDQNRISRVKSSIRNAFQKARDHLTEKSVPLQGSLSSNNKKIYLTDLQALVGDIFPEEILPLLLRNRFDSTLERRIVEIFDEVLEKGILQDPERFSEERRVGIIIRDSSYPYEHLKTDAKLVRNLSEAREYLREFDLDLRDWTEDEKEKLIRFMQSALVPTLIYNSEETKTRKELAASQVPAVEGQIKAGQTVVQYGQPITENLLSQLKALRNLSKPSSIILRGIGFFIFIVVLLYALWRYLVFYKSRIAIIRKNAALILLIIASELLILRLATALADILNERFDWFADPTTLYYAIPFALGPLLVTRREFWSDDVHSSGSADRIVLRGYHDRTVLYHGQSGRYLQHPAIQGPGCDTERGVCHRGVELHLFCRHIYFTPDPGFIYRRAVPGIPGFRKRCCRIHDRIDNAAASGIPF
ncbi:MAG: hypothetical protein P8Z37_07885 [Acidobacteriota bacterium]